MVTDVAGQDELAQLEAERDRLLSMIAYQNGPFYQISLKYRTLACSVAVAIAIIFVVGALIVAGFPARQISASGLVFSVVGVGLLAYILTRRITVSGSSFLAGEILVPFGDNIGVMTPPGECEAHQRLAECEARIVTLKDGRP
jgi:hypothetical protein